MTVKELIAELQKYDENMRVKVFEETCGNIDITEVVKFEGVSANPLCGFPRGCEYVCII